MRTSPFIEVREEQPDVPLYEASLIKSDLFRYAGKTTRKSFIKTLISVPGFRYSLLLRKANFHLKNKNKLRFNFYRILIHHYMVKYGYEISYTTSIGKGFYIGHLGGIAVNPRTVIGDNVNIHKGVTIGQTNRGKRQGCPTIGNNVWIGSNAVVVGKVTIGNNVLIAPGAYINFDVPDNSLVLGNPGTIKPSLTAVDGYVNNRVS